MITSLYRGPEGGLAHDVSSEEMAQAVSNRQGVLWVDLQAPEATEARALLDGVFRFHHLTVDDCLNRHVDTPKVDDYGDYLFIIAQTIRSGQAPGTFEASELDLYLGPNYVVSFHSEAVPPLDDVRRRFVEDGGPLARHGADFLAQALLDAAVDQFLPFVEEMEAQVDRLEEAVLGDPQASVLQDILHLKRGTLRLRRTLLPQRDVVNRFARGEFSALVSADLAFYFRDIYDHVVRVEEMTESLRDLADSVLNTYLSAVNNRMNEVMKVLSIVAAVFLPLTLISGIYGTNFENLPELGWQWGYFGMLGAMALIGLGLIAFFRWRRWF